MAGKVFSLFFIFNLAVLVASYELQQVFVLSRHNIRAPLSEDLQTVTTLKWPEWNVPASFLTEKGVEIEEKMGKYFYQWLKSTALLTDECPSDESVYIYPNKVHRTIETAEAFARSAFMNCNVVHYKKNNQKEFMFLPIVRNTTDSFREDYVFHMNEKLDNLKLKDAYQILNRIMDMENSDICKQQKLCDFMAKDSIVYQVGEEPNVNGPLAIGNSVADFFLMSYYNGSPMEDIAWGKLDQKDFETLLKLTRENQNVRFNQSYLSRDISRPMLKYMRDKLLDSPASKFTMLVGHDSNLNSVMAALGFSPYSLTGQLELTPIGGKIVFQKWRGDDSNLYLKIEYVYYSMEQLRNGVDLEKPLSKTMELKDCKVNTEGFCPWSDFVKVLNIM
ncbi:glucose-1-phosphatase-like [Ostrinia nubilalis]|uniref:glucose-1-phosphatase-like n=1 Tax=Ostrinia nubilalis TaxID=29057 RepID=UPI0030824BD4